MLRRINQHQQARTVNPQLYQSIFIIEQVRLCLNLIQAHTLADALPRMNELEK
jgi:hypothetical protein